MHNLHASFVLGFHGCNESVAEDLLAGKPFTPSKNEYDWLGHGIYFWEANPRRGLEYARELKKLKRPAGPKIEKPAVVGAIIDLGNCLDLTTSAGLKQVYDAYTNLTKVSEAAGMQLPNNSPDGMRRNLDCATITFLHAVKQDQGQPAINTVRSVFMEGDPLYPDSGFMSKTHIQICVCTIENIKGVFRVDPRFLE